MELKLSVKENSPSHNSEIKSQFSKNICVVSCENVVVFTRVVFRSSSFKQSIPVYTIYAADINTLFEPHVIMESLDPIVKLKFSPSGSHLLVVTFSKNVFLYSKGCNLHQWSNTHTTNWSEEELLHIEFFRPSGKAFIPTSELNLNSSYSDKFQSLSFKPTLSNLGSCHRDGFFAVTSSGLFLACTFNSNGVVDSEVRTILGPIRDYFLVATSAFDSGGSIHVAAWKRDLVKCWEVQLSSLSTTDDINENDHHFNNSSNQDSGSSGGNDGSDGGSCCSGSGGGGGGKLRARVVSTNFFCPQTQNCEGGWSGPLNVTHLSFGDADDATSLLLFVESAKSESSSAQSSDSKNQHQVSAENQHSGIGSSSSSSSSVVKDDVGKTECRFMVQRYCVQVKSRPLFQFFHSQSTSSTSSSVKEKPPAVTASIEEWVCVGEWRSPHSVTAVSPPPPGLLTEFSSKFICVSTAEGSVSVVNRDTMQQISKYTLPSRLAVDDRSGKRASSGGERRIVSMATTWTSLHLLALDSNGTLLALSLLKQGDVACTWLSYLVVTLEYCLVSSHDWCDVLMAVPCGSALTVAEKLTENFNQNSHHKVASQLQSKFLVVKNSVMRLSSNLHQKSIEPRLQAQLVSILKVFRSLRPITADAANSDSNFFSKISSYVESRVSLELTDVDKALEKATSNFNLLDFQIDPSLVQDLQVLLEFAVDLSLYLLLLLVQNSKYELTREVKTLQLLREILLLARLWFKRNKLVLPQALRKTDAVDIWAQIYKLLTRLTLIMPSGEPDPAFLDDCITLEAQVLCREIPLFVSPRGVLGCLATSSPAPPQYPLQFYYEQRDPNPPISSVNPRPLEGSLSSAQPFDLLYYHFLGSSGVQHQCTRCFSTRGRWWGSSEFSLWEQEWSNRCICSGHWGPSSMHPPSRAG